MPSIIRNGSPASHEVDFLDLNEDKEDKSVNVEGTYEIQLNGDSTLRKRRLRSEARHDNLISSPKKPRSPTKWISPRRCINSINGAAKVINRDSIDASARSLRSPMGRFSDSFPQSSKWNPKDSKLMIPVKELLHVSTAPSAVVCREEEQEKVFDFCKACLEQDKAGSLYVCGCPGTGKSLSMEKVKWQLVEWTEKVRFQTLDALEINCTSLANTSEIFSKIWGKYQSQKKINSPISPLQQLQNLFSQKNPSSCEKKMLIIVDELDYLITRDREFSSAILSILRIANAIDLADRFLPTLQSLNCKPMVVNFRAYSKDQILRILQQRLMAFPHIFQPEALELCARKVAAASGDMRKALCVCRSAIEMLEAENIASTFGQQSSTTTGSLPKQETDFVTIELMAIALSKAFKSPIVDTIQSLPQHQQIILCSAVKLFRQGKKDTSIGELNTSYLEVCKSVLIPPVGIMEFSSMCRVLSDQGLLKLGVSREDKLKRVTLKVDEADITFSLQGIRFFQNCLL